MIIKNICLLLEALSIVICLYHLYGEKFRLDIATVSFLSIDMIIMTAINYFGMPETYLTTMIIYPIIALYCGIRFGFKLKPIIVNIVLCVSLVGMMQMIGALLIYCLYKVHEFADYKLLLVNCVTYLFALIMLPRLKVDRLSKYLQNKEKILFTAICSCLIVVFFVIINYKRIKFTEVINTMVLFLCILFISILSINVIKYKIKAAEIEMELKMHRLYSESFQGLIDNIRLRQHEFDNHIHAIYSQHYSNNTYEGLVEAQRDYCEKIVAENRFHKLLAQDNPIIRGFLYGRFIEIDKMGIEISYQVAIKELDIGVPIYKLVEILGDLMNNAVEALVADEKRNKMHIAILETDKFFLEVRNESPYIEYDVLGNFFNKGYSKKGENRGLGLYNVKQICEEYGLSIGPEWEEMNGRGWLSFKVWKVI